MYVFSGLATVQVLIFGAVLTFGGYDKAGWKIQQGRSLFNLVLSVENMLLCMFQRLCTYFQDTGVLIFGGYVLSGHCSRQQISGKNEGVLIFGGVLIYGVLRYSRQHTHRTTRQERNQFVKRLRCALEIEYQQTDFVLRARWKSALSAGENDTDFSNRGRRGNQNEFRSK